MGQGKEHLAGKKKDMKRGENTGGKASSGFGPYISLPGKTTILSLPIPPSTEFVHLDNRQEEGGKKKRVQAPKQGN